MCSGVGSDLGSFPAESRSVSGSFSRNESPVEIVEPVLCDIANVEIR